MKNHKRFLAAILLFFSFILVVGCAKKTPNKTVKTPTKVEVTKFVTYSNQDNFKTVDDYHQDINYKYTLVNKHNYRLERRVLNNMSHFEIDIEDGTYEIEDEKITFVPKKTVQKFFTNDFEQFQTGDKPITVNIFENGEFEDSENIPRSFDYSKKELTADNIKTPLIKKVVTKKPETLASLVKESKKQYQDFYGQILGKNFASPALNSTMQNKISFDDGRFVWRYISGSAEKANKGILNGIVVFDGQNIRLDVTDKTDLYIGSAELLQQNQYDQISNLPDQIKLSFENGKISISDSTSMNFQPMAIDESSADVKIDELDNTKNEMHKKVEKQALTGDQKLAARVSDYLSLLNNEKFVPTGWKYADYRGKRIYGPSKPYPAIDMMETGFYLVGEKLYKIQFPPSGEDPYLLSEKEGQFYKEAIPQNGVGF